MSNRLQQHDKRPGTLPSAVVHRDTATGTSHRVPTSAVAAQTQPSAAGLPRQKPIWNYQSYEMSTDDLARRQAAAGRTRGAAAAAVSSSAPTAGTAAARQQQQRQQPQQQQRQRQQSVTQRKRPAAAAPVARRPAAASASGGAGVKKRRAKPGIRALQEIRKLQRTVRLVIPKKPFYRLLKEILQKIQDENPNRPILIKKEAVEALQESTENFLVGLLAETQEAAIHAKRVTIMKKDMQLVRIIKNKNTNNNSMI